MEKEEIKKDFQTSSIILNHIIKMENLVFSMKHINDIDKEMKKENLKTPLIKKRNKKTMIIFTKPPLNELSNEFTTLDSISNEKPMSPM